MVFGIFKRKQARVVPAAPAKAYDPVADMLAKSAAAKAEQDAQHATMDLEVQRVDKVAEGVIAITFADPVGNELPAWEPGAHLELHLPSGINRQYSLCGSPKNEFEYRVSVLREENGRGGSKELHDTDLVGKVLKVAGPRNHFELVESPKYVFIAGGIGITPIRAMVASLDDDADWKLIYGGRTASSMAFVDELTEICGDRLTLVPQDTDGLIDLKGAVEGAGAETAIYCCGPSVLIDAMEKVAAEHAPEAQFHFERFTASEEAAAERAAKAVNDTAFELELRRSGITKTVPADQSVLDAILVEKPNFDFSCEEGHCGSCFATVLEGKIDHRDEVLTEEERETGDTMYVCVSRPTTDKLVLDV